MSLGDFATRPIRRSAEANQIHYLLDAPPQLLESLPIAIYACDFEGRILWFNERAADLWGRRPRIGDASERYCGSHKLYFDGREISREETPMAGVLRTGIPVRGAEARVVRPDGSSVWAEVHIEPLKGDGGQIIGAINCFHETSALHHTEDELEDFFENAAIGLHLVSGNGVILRANRAELQMLGYTAEQYVGRNIAEFHVDQENIEDILSRLRAGEQITERPARLRAKDGSIRSVLLTTNARKWDGEIVNTRCCTVDITGRVEAEALAREQAQRLAATHQHADIGIAEVDATGKLVRVNANLAALLRRTPEELLGRSIFASEFAEDVAQDQAQFERQVKGEIDRYTIEKRFLCADGTKLWVSISSSTVRDPDGRFLYAVRVQHDMTEQRRVEDALARRVEEQTALFEFTAGMQRAETLDQIYANALDAILRALRCEKASILLFDAAGIIRFVAARGLSEAYRGAVEGHSPWHSGEKDPAPICIEDIETADLPSGLKDVIRAEGIAALAFIPIFQSGLLIGKFMTYYDRPHSFETPEIGLAVTVARQLGFAIERMHAEMARRRTERAAQQLVAIVESSDDAIISKDLNGIIQTWNQGAERLFGYRAEEVVGQPITIVIPQDRLDEEPGILARIRRGERVDHYETIRRRKDGSFVDISLTISPVLDAEGTITGASKIARDITEQKKIEAKLRDNERQLRELLSAIPAAIYTTDAAGKITYFNEAAVELSGRTPVLGTDEWCVTWKLFWPDGTPLPHDECPMAIALKEGRAVRNVEAVAERPDGTRVPFIPYPTPLRDENGSIVGAINMLVDVSERKQAETQQRILFNELNHRVKNNMQMLQSLLRLAGRQTNSDEARKVLSDASNRIAAMAAAQQVLYATTNATGLKAPAFLKAVCQTMRPLFLRPVNIVTEATDIEISNDAAMPLALILNELLTNAVKYGMSENGEGLVRIRLSRDEEQFHLSVEDDGPGFDMPAVRQRSSGLQLVQGLARQLGGRFEVTRDLQTRCSVYFS
jgi:PAS domain S-box-containing protein